MTAAKKPRNYRQIGNGAIVLEEALPYLRGIDSILLDIDGVVLDVRQSFRRAISLTVQKYFREFISLKGRKFLVNYDDTSLFKNAGGFNNDWDLTYFACLYYVVKMIKRRPASLEELKGDGKDLLNFLKRAQSNQWGFAGSLEELLKSAPANVAKKALQKTDKDQIVKIFQELYAGVDQCQFIYGFTPKFIKKRGLMNGEKVIIKKDLLQEFKGRIGVITGRTREEAICALKTADLTRRIKMENVIYDDGIIVKPDPRAIKLLAKKFKSKSLIFLGDTPDDLLTVRNYVNAEVLPKVGTDQIGSDPGAVYKLGKRVPIVMSGIVAKNKDDWEIFKGLGAEIIAQRTDQILKVLNDLRRK